MRNGEQGRDGAVVVFGAFGAERRLLESHSSRHVVLEQVLHS